MNVAKLSALLLIILFGPTPASAASQLMLSPSGSNSFILQGIGVEGAAAVECTVTYDATLLGNPRVEIGGMAAGAMLAVNPNVPGTLRIALVRTTPMTGSGTIATIMFDRKGDAAGRIISMNAKLVAVDGKPMALSVSVGNPTDQQASTTSPVNQEAPGRTSPSPGSGPSGQNLPVLMPFPGAPAVPPRPQEQEKDAGDEPKRDREQPLRRDRPVQEPVSVAKKTDESSHVASRGIYTQKSVLERFREYRGEPTVPAYIALFEKEEMIGFRQDPPVAVTDGKRTVRLIFISASSDRKSSDIAVMGANLLSLARDPDYSNTFVVELLPSIGEYRASVSVPQEGVLMVYPLTVVPKVPIVLTKTGMVDEEGFKAFLRERGTKEKPGHDLNGDGRRDYLDDYLYTANYLAALYQARDRKEQK